MWKSSGFSVRQTKVDLTRNDSFFLAVFVSRILSDPDDKVEIDRFDLPAFFHQNRAVCHFFDHTFKLTVQTGNNTIFINKFLCKLFHFGVPSRFSLFDYLSYDHCTSIAVQNTQHYKEKQYW